jgi:hypothetical protein
MIPPRVRSVGNTFKLQSYGRIRVHRLGSWLVYDENCFLAAQDYDRIWRFFRRAADKDAAAATAVAAAVATVATLITAAATAAADTSSVSLCVFV